MLGWNWAENFLEFKVLEKAMENTPSRWGPQPNKLVRVKIQIVTNKRDIKKPRYFTLQLSSQYLQF